MNVRETCPACNGNDNEPCFVLNGYNIKRCLGCATMFIENLPNSESLAAIYTSDSYYDLSPDSMIRIINENKSRLRLIQNFKPRGRFLDIGCAQGLLLDQAKKIGYETFGIEPAEKNAETAVRKGHIVINGELKEFVTKCSERNFDVITCLDVIEHIEEPESFLALSSTLLAENGIMVISTPNYSGVVAKLLGASDPYMIPPEHVNFFTMDGIKFLTARCGLKISLFRCFGSLIPAEMDRSIQRYIPKHLQIFTPLIRPIVKCTFLLMNYLNAGLEQEVYLTKLPKNGPG